MNSTVSWSVLLPSCSSQFICTQMWNHPVGNPLPHRVLHPPPCRESSLSSCPSPPFLPVWMNVSSLTPWSSDFHTVRFSVGSGWFCSYICCCPSFGCVRRHSVSTYASIIARSPDNWSLPSPEWEYVSMITSRPATSGQCGPVSGGLEANCKDA